MKKLERTDGFVAACITISLAQDFPGIRAQRRAILDDALDPPPRLIDRGLPRRASPFRLAAPFQQVDEQVLQPGFNLPLVTASQGLDFLREVVVVEGVRRPVAEGAPLLDRPLVKVFVLFHRSEYIGAERGLGNHFEGGAISILGPFDRGSLQSRDAF